MSGILEKVAARLGRTRLSRAEYEIRFAQLKDGAEAPVFPQMPTDTLGFFNAQAERNLFELERFDDSQQALAALKTSLPLALSPQQTVSALPWRKRGFAVTDNLSSPVLGIIEARWGIAETGTVAVDSTEVPSRLLFLAEELLVMLDTKNIVRVQDDLWPHMGDGHRRVTHLISGPSRTADVEQTLQVGAHGPRRVYLWLLG